MNPPLGFAKVVVHPVLGRPVVPKGDVAFAPWVPHHEARLHGVGVEELQ